MKALRVPGSITAWSLAALAVGCFLGLVGHSSGDPAFARLARALEPAADLWLAALQVIVLPLVVFHGMAVIVDARDRGGLGALGARSILLFVTMLVGVALITIAAASALVARYPVDPVTVAAFAEATPSSPDPAPSTGSFTFLGWLTGLLRGNPVSAALEGNVLPLLAMGMAIAFAVTLLPGQWRDLLSRGIRSAAGATLELTRRLLWLLPLGVLVLVFPVVLAGGGGLTGFLAWYVVIQCALVLAVTLLLYPATALLGRIPLAAFARGVAPAQLVAATTRSSLASLPALVEGGRDRLRLPAAGTAIVLPLAVALFKLSRTVSAPLRLFVLAHVYGIPLDSRTVSVFVVTVILLSFGTVGLPSGVLPAPTIPAYVAAGIPLEGVVILEAVDAIPDMFKTVMNVTGDMSAATILTHSSRAGPFPEPS